MEIKEKNFLAQPGFEPTTLRISQMNIFLTKLLAQTTIFN